MIMTRHFARTQDKNDDDSQHQNQSKRIPVIWNRPRDGFVFGVGVFHVMLRYCVNHSSNFALASSTPAFFNDENNCTETVFIPSNAFCTENKVFFCWFGVSLSDFVNKICRCT